MTLSTRALKRPIPRTFEYWESEVRGLINFMEHKPALIDDFGVDWFNRVRLYKYERLEVLLTYPPSFPPGYVAPLLSQFTDPQLELFDPTKAGRR